MQIAEMKAEIARLESLIKSTEADNRKAGYEAMKAFKPDYQWRVEWKNEYTVRVERKLTDASTAERQAILNNHPGYSETSFDDLLKWDGMDYLIVRGQHIVSVGGGLCVLEAGSSWDPPRKLTNKELAALLAGDVPKSLHYKG